MSTTEQAASLSFDRPGQLVRPDSDWTRDDSGRPWVLPDPDWTPDTAPAAWLKDGQVLPGRNYTRVTTFVEAPLDGTMLARWKMRRVALGMGRRPDYVVAAAALTAEDRDREALNDLAEKALEAAGPNAADIGTALHGFSERIDRGEPLGFVPDQYREDLERYREVVQRHLTWKHREERMVCDALEVAGTPDGLAWCDQPDPDGVVDLLRVVDLKTGNVERTAGKFSAQLGVYAHSACYDPGTGRRTWLADLDRRWGLVLHMPAGVGTAELRWLNLEHGWLGARLAGPVRRWRSVNHADLMRPLIPVERVVADGLCRGIKRDGGACGYKAKADGLCARHQGQDPDAVRPARVQEVAAELESVLEELEQPATDPFVGITTTDALEDSSTAVDDAVDVEPHRFAVGTPYGQWPALCATCGLVAEDARGQHITGPIGGGTVELNGNPRPHTSMPDPDAAEDAAAKAELALMDQVRACRSSGELQVLYETTGSAWTDAVRKYASRHRELLPELGRQERARAALLVAIRAAESQQELRRLFGDPRNAELITDEHKQAAKLRASQLPPF